MGARSSIEWLRGADGSEGSTWNPIRARNAKTGRVGWHCEPVCAACAHCYAETFNRDRLGTKLPYKPGHLDNGDVEVFLDEKTLLAPLKWKKPRFVFPCSMTDLFGRWVTDAMLDRIFAVMALAQRHTYIVLTKRAERMRDYLGTPRRDGIVVQTIRSDQLNGRMPGLGLDGAAWPLPNVWLGVSIGTKRELGRIDALRATPARKRVLSLEPLLEDLGDFDLAGIDGMFVGGESGDGARPPHPAWIRRLRDRSAEAGVAFHFKQWGAWMPLAPHEVADPGFEFQFDDGQKMLFVGKKRAGRLLDGRTWDDLPEVRT